MNYSTQELRKRAMEAHERGNSAIDVAEMFGVHRATVHRWIARAQQDVTLARKTGSGRRSVLSDKQYGRLLRIILKPASSFGFETDFWTSSRIIEVARKRLKVIISRSTMCKMLRASEFSYKKPERRYYEADDQRRTEWLKLTVPEIKRTIKKYRAILYFEDEATVRLTGVLARTWGPRGKRTIQKATGIRGTVPVMSALGSHGNLLFQLYDQRISSDEVLSFLSEMLKHHPRRHLVVVMDRARPHTSKKVVEFIKTQRRLHVFYLPPYSPDFNPDEQVWNHLKNEKLKGHQARSVKELREITQNKLSEMSSDESTLRALFFRSCVADLFA